MSHAKQQEIEAKAARYAQLHPDEDGRDPSVGAIGRALRRVRAAFARRS
jgi:hypothetical protein